MRSITARAAVAVTATGAALLAMAVPVDAQPSPVTTSATRAVDQPKHQHEVRVEPLRGATFVCGDLTLRVTRGRSVETNEGDLRDGLAHVYVSRIWRRVLLHGSDGRTYRASGVTVAWFVFRAADLETPVHGLEVVQVMFRGGPDKSPGWLRERVAWSHKHESDVTHGPCDFGD
jgi:hypothetical protein